MANAIYALKIELLFRGNEEALHLTGRQLHGLQRFNRFVILVYIQSWYSCSLAVDAAFNDIALIHRLQEYDDVELSRVGLRVMVRHTWYLSPELASLAYSQTMYMTRSKFSLLRVCSKIEADIF